MSLTLPSHHGDSPFVKRIEKLYARMGDQKGKITLVAHSQGLMADPTTHAARAGIKHFSEYFLPEGIAKLAVVNAREKNLIWHYCGSLDSKKIKVAVEHFDWIDALDRTSLVKNLAEAVDMYGKVNFKVMIEVNPLGPKKRLGMEPSQLEEMVEKIQKYPQMVWRGFSFQDEHFMSKDDCKMAYEKMQVLFEKVISKKWISREKAELAMGTTKTIEMAVQNGSTMLRCKSGVFGPHVQAQVENVNDPF